MLDSITCGFELDRHKLELLRYLVEYELKKGVTTWIDEPDDWAIELKAKDVEQLLKDLGWLLAQSTDSSIYELQEKEVDNDDL